MNIDIKLHKEDLPDQLSLGDNIAVDCEFMGLNVERDALCLVQISTGNNDAHIVKLNRDTYDAPNLKKVLEDKNIELRAFPNEVLQHLKKITMEVVTELMESDPASNKIGSAFYSYLEKVQANSNITEKIILDTRT